MEKITTVFKALSDPNRLRILKMLEDKPLCVCEITHVVGLATSTVSSHLSLLRKADLIRSEKNGKWVDYRLNATAEKIESRQMLSLLPVWLNDDQQIVIDKEKLKDTDREKLCSIDD